MSEITNSDGASESEKPVLNEVKFPPFPEPSDQDFDEDIPEEERSYYREKFKDLNTIKTYRLHCSACDRHMGCSARNERMRAHPLLRTLVCHTCHTFYNSGEFEKGDDGSELYCRWCGQGGQVYCCSDCPHVFCAKCIKRNLGVPKIKEIENADDWKCFKCKPEALKDLRSICWAVLRYCDLKNKITYQTQDADLKAAYQKDCTLDPSECCKHKSKRNQKSSDSQNKKKDIKKESEPKVTAVVSKIPSTIQVKKFAALAAEETVKTEKKAQKRPVSPKSKPFYVKNPIAIAPSRLINPVCVPPLAKKLRLPNNNAAMRFPVIQDRKTFATYTRIKPKNVHQLPIQISSNSFNGFSGNVFHCPNPINDNINLSLESLTQGLDMAAVAALSNNNTLDDDVVCTPDFPIEPLCEVTEDNDDDVECITPGPVATPRFENPPPLVARSKSSSNQSTSNICNVPDVSPDNIIQMTDNDVTVNEHTGGLKFRVDPQTLSSNKMYRLPDGRIFAINANPTMPGGYSATIVAVTESNKTAPKGATFAAKLSSVSTSTPSPSRSSRMNRLSAKSTPNILNRSSKSKTSDSSSRECDLNVPIEWYRYNLIDAVDALEYSLSRLHKLKKEATSVYLRTRSVNEMRSLHRNLERLLNTSSSRFSEIRENLNKGLKQYVAKKASGGNTSEEDDDVEILPDIDDDPIFIDENSTESNCIESQEVDLTGPGSSEYNDSGENRSNFDKVNLSENDIENGETPNDISDNDKSIKQNSKNKNGSNDNDCIIKDTKKNDNDPLMLIPDDLKSDESTDGMNGERENPSHKKDVKNKDKDETNLNVEKDADCEVISENNTNFPKITLSCDEKMIVDTDEKPIDEKTSDETNGKETDNTNEKTKDSYETVQFLDEQLLENEDKFLVPDDKTPDTSDKINSDDKMQEDPFDKLQDTEMSQELIETLLKDDSSQDNNTNSEVPEALQVN